MERRLLRAMIGLGASGDTQPGPWFRLALVTLFFVIAWFRVRAT